MSKSKSILRRVIAFAGAVIITLNVVAAPQRARAVAVTASVVASVAAIMTACGVTYWAASQTDAIEYLGGKIDAYLGSLETVPQSYEDWLGIDAASQLFDVVSGGVMRFGSGVANKVLDFVRWFNTEEGVVSGGSAVGNGTAVDISSSIYNPYSLSYSGSGSVDVLSATELQINVDFADKRDNSDFAIQAIIPCNAGEKITVSYNAGDVSSSLLYAGPINFCYSVDASISTSDVAALGLINDNSSRTLTPTNDYFVLRFLVGAGYSSSSFRSGTVKLHLSVDDLKTADTALVTPGAVVSVPDAIDDADNYDVAPSAPLTQGMSVAQASEAVLDGVASEDGLTSEGETAGGAAAGWGWLADLLERIREAVQGTHEVAQGTQETVQGMQEAVEGTQQAVEGTQEAVEGMQEAVEGIQHAVQPAQYSAIGSYQLDLTNFFPFCIPWDLFRGLSLLVADPVAPSIDWEVPLPDGSTYTLSLDFSEFDGVAQVARTMELLAFVVALAVATKKLIKW